MNILLRKVNCLLLFFLIVFLTGCSVDEQLGTSNRTQLESQKEIAINENDNSTNLQIEQIKATTIAQLAILTATTVAHSNDTNLLINKNDNETLITITNKNNDFYVEILFYAFLVIVVSIGISSYFYSKKQQIIVLPNVTNYPKLISKNQNYIVYKGTEGIQDENY